MEMWLQRQAHYSLSCLWHSAHKLSAIYLTLKYLKTNSILLIHITLVMNKNDRGVISQIMIFGHLPPGPPPLLSIWYLDLTLETSYIARPVQLGRDRSGYVRLPNWSENDQSPQVPLGQGRSVSVRLPNLSEHDLSPQVVFGQVRSGQVEIPNWSHTGLNLTNPLWSDLVVIG